MLSFWEWIDRDSPLSQADRVLVLIRQAGPQGISRRIPRRPIRLEKETLDQLLADRLPPDLATRERGLITYRTR